MFTLPNGIRLGLYLSGLAAVGYLTYAICADPIWTGAVVLVARWLKPYR